MPRKQKAGLASNSVDTPSLLADEPAFASALDQLARHDAAFMATVDAACGRPRLRRRAAGFEGLAAIIVAQQVSTASANAIFARLEGRFVPLDASAILAAEESDLKVCGLSAPKMRTLRAIATAVAEGSLDFESLARAPAEAAHATLCAIKGIGPWTADIFLLFCLGHADAFPSGDLALQEGARLALGLDLRPTAKELLTLSERWRPLRGSPHTAFGLITAWRDVGRQRLEETPRSSHREKAS